MNKTFLKTLPILQSQLLSKEAGIVHFSTLRGCDECDKNKDGCDKNKVFGKYNLCSYSGDTLEHVLWSRKAYAEALGITTERMWFPRQVHGTDIIVLSKSSENNNLNKDITQKYEEETTAYYDAVLTDEKRLLIGVSTADCVPILLYDPIKEVVGAVHAGWRGTVARIATKSIMKLSEVFGCNPLDIKAMIGPSISPEAFEVGDEVAVQFAENGFADCIVNGYEKPHIDLWKTNRKQLIQSGLLVENIDCTPICTYHNSDILFSARKLGIKSGRIISAIMLL